MVEVFATPDATRRFADLLGGVAVDRGRRPRAGLAGEAVTPAGLVAVCRLLDRPLDHVVRAGARLVAVCAEVRDPGNAGTVVRTTDAAGGDAVVLAGEAVDLHNPKTLRASAGSAFHVPVAVEPDPDRALAVAREAGLQLLAADGDGEVDLTAPPAGLLERPTAWLLGNEAHGLDAGLLAAADHRVRVPLHGRAESLNLASTRPRCASTRRRTAQRRPAADLAWAPWRRPRRARPAPRRRRAGRAGPAGHPGLGGRGADARPAAHGPRGP